MNVTLIGMAGSGKSYLGAQVAQRLGLDFVDGDTLLAQKYGKPIHDILEELGPEKYVLNEAKLLTDMTARRDNLLISPGGSIVYSDAAMKHLKKISTVIHVRAPFEMIEKRLHDLRHRAIVGLGEKTLRELYFERLPLYEKAADITVDADGLDSEAVLTKILEHL